MQRAVATAVVKTLVRNLKVTTKGRRTTVSTSILGWGAKIVVRDDGWQLQLRRSTR